MVGEDKTCFPVCLHFIIACTASESRPFRSRQSRREDTRSNGCAGDEHSRESQRKLWDNAQVSSGLCLQVRGARARVCGRALFRHSVTQCGDDVGDLVPKPPHLCLCCCPVTHRRAMAMVLCKMRPPVDSSEVRSRSRRCALSCVWSRVTRDSPSVPGTAVGVGGLGGGLRRQRGCAGQVFGASAPCEWWVSLSSSLLWEVPGRGLTG